MEAEMADSRDTELWYCYNCMNHLDAGQDICPVCGWNNTVVQNPVNTLPEGTVLAGKYLIGKMLGQGGFGITYLGFDLALDVRVAVKEFFPVGVCMRARDSIFVVPLASASEPGDFQKSCEEFQTEAKRLARFNSPNIVHVRDYFRENETAYIVMDYVEGNSLTKEVAELGGRIPWERVLALTMPLMQELDKLHEEHLIHRDIKPDNLKIVKDKKPGKEYLILLDFGSARSFISESITRTYTAMVTPGYSPFEQYTSRSRQGPYTDVYALCATIYALICGELPASATDRVGGIADIRSFSSFGLDVPASVDEVIRHGLAVHAADRPQTMLELYDEFSEAMEEKSGSESADSLQNDVDARITMNICYSCMKELEPGQIICPYCGNDNSVQHNYQELLREGTILHGKYLVGWNIDRDGFGNSYIGLELESRSKVKIKEYAQSWLHVRELDTQSLKVIKNIDPVEKNIIAENLKKIHQAAMIQINFNSPGIEHVRDYFEENGTVYVVMDYIEGISLQSEIKKNGGKLSWRRVLSLIMPLMPEIDKLHKKGLLYEAINPGSMLLIEGGTREEKAVLQEYGFFISPYDPDGDLFMYMTERNYFSAEMFAEKAVKGPWSDVYSLCATIYALISGEVPCSAVDRITNVEKLKTFTELGLNIPYEIEKVIQHGMEINPKNRPQNMSELYDEFEKAMVPLVHEKEQVIRSGTTNQKQEKSINKRLLFFILIFLAAAGVFYFIYPSLNSETKPLQTIAPAVTRFVGSTPTAGRKTTQTYAPVRDPNQTFEVLTPGDGTYLYVGTSVDLDKVRFLTNGEKVVLTGETKTTGGYEWVHVRAINFQSQNEGWIQKNTITECNPD